MSALAGRGPVLHARARRLPLAAAAVLAVAAFSVGAERWSVLLERADVRSIAVDSVLVFVPLAAAVVLSVTLSGADVELEATSPRLSARGRSVRAVVTVALACLTLALAVTLSPGGAAASVVARNTAGLFGTVLLAVTLVPPILAWLPAFLYAGSTFLITSRPTSLASAWWSFLVQPVRLDASWVTAGVLLVAGVVAYAVRGPRRSTA